MTNIAQAYNDLTPHYHLIFQDWYSAIKRQAGIISRFLPSPQEAGPVLDCSCGIGTQALGLAALGYEVEGTDISPGAVDRARRESASLGLNASFRVDDMRTLTTSPTGRYGAVLCMDNSLPHLDSDEQISTALEAMRSRMKSDGVLLLSLRDYEKLIAERPSIMPPAFFQDGEFRRFVHQVWDWTDERSYRFHLYLTFENGNGWQVHHVTGTYRAVTPAEVAALTERAGFKAVRVLSAGESGYYQPIIRALA
jgi:glycine/sarcosine N-methyltransferase